MRTGAHLEIAKLQTRTPHIVKNKLSDKFNRRDVQFYDLYIKKECGDELARLKDNAFPLDIDAEQYYNEMEIDDFNKIFYDDQLIQQKFGRSIKIQLELKSESMLIRKVTEDATKVVIHDERELSPQKNQMRDYDADRDPDLLTLDSQLKQFEKQYGKTTEEVADAFVRVSGRLNKMKDYFENRPVVEWNYLEDMALTKPDDSPEFQVLLHTKGFDEIKIRRDFLQATPVISEEIKENNP